MGAQLVVSFTAGIVFAIGLGLAGMTQPQNIISFLDLRAWNPQLLFVMVGAIAVFGVASRFVTRRAGPVLGGAFELPTRRDISWQLVLGSCIFGVGWGLAGFCPGPALVALVSGQLQVGVFVAAMLVGVGLSRVLLKT